MIAAGGIAYAGLSALCASFDRHHRQIQPGKSKPSAQKHFVVRALGWLLVALSLWISVRAWGIGIGWVAWFGILSCATTLLVLQLAYAPRRILFLASVTGVVSLLVAAAT